MFEWILIFIMLIVIIILFIKYSKLKGEVSIEARKIFEEWRGREIENIRREYDLKVEEKAKMMFEDWRQREEEKIRMDAIAKSTSTIIGKVGEQLAPILILSNYGVNPKDLRFIGTPIDYIVFKGLSDEKLEKIIFVEVKSGKIPSLTQRERRIREVIESRNIEYLLIHYLKN